jgi:hypothetical protein
MIEGHSFQFEYAGTDGANWIAKLTPTDTHAFSGPDDSQWLVFSPIRREIQYEWLYFKAWDGSAWRAKAKCTYTIVNQNAMNPDGEPIIYTTFEQERPNGDNYGHGEGNHDDITIGFLDWEGKPWKATAMWVTRWPAPPVFKLEKAH